MDGMPLSATIRKVDHVLLPPAGRVEAIVIGPPSVSAAALSTRCVDTGLDGDANPAMVIADVGGPGGPFADTHRRSFNRSGGA